MKQRALEDVERLYNVAVSSASSTLSQNALDAAWSLLIHTDAPVPKKVRLIRCKGCGSVLLPSRTKVYVKNGYAVWSCAECKTTKRFRYK